MSLSKQLSAELNYYNGINYFYRIKNSNLKRESILTVQIIKNHHLSKKTSDGFLINELFSEHINSEINIKVIIQKVQIQLF